MEEFFDTGIKIHILKNCAIAIAELIKILLLKFLDKFSVPCDRGIAEVNSAMLSTADHLWRTADIF